MTDRYNALTVVLTENMRPGDAQYVIDAISMIKFVEDVRPHVADHVEEHVVSMRLKTEFQAKLWKLQQEMWEGDGR